MSLFPQIIHFFNLRTTRHFAITIGVITSTKNHTSKLVELELIQLVWLVCVEVDYPSAG